MYIIAFSSSNEKRDALGELCTDIFLMNVTGIRRFVVNAWRPDFW